ncbi:MAG: sugar phosphate isomerase/epimerase [Chloroflexi bacterium]|nr:sugar phosphate isomerase/epimerase [Chloroflexota bacterium]MBU1752052.1 sugar phosphate isomerase/epimerase [Chloroflexota bacterium]MBU1878828.1 sugar phosphate isomerase/epimerase [Chloroflexota bacterium]
MRIGASLQPVVGLAVNPHDSAGSQARHLAAIRDLAQRGAQVVELGLDFATIYPTVFDPSFFAQVTELGAELDCAFTAHLPFLWMDPASLVTEVREATVTCLRRAISALGDLTVESYVLHPTGPLADLAYGALPPAVAGMFVGLMMGELERTVLALLDLIPAAKLCLENLETVPFADYVLPLVEEHDLGVCLDVGHLPFQGLRVTDLLAVCGERVREVHLHDVTRRIIGNRCVVLTDHQALGTGEQPYGEILAQLQAQQFAGCVIVENDVAAATFASLQTLRDDGWLSRSVA